MKQFTAGVLTGLLMYTAVLCIYFFRQKEDDLEKVKVTQVSGEKIEHSGFNYKGSSIVFDTESQGKGKIITEIPKTNIPEAKAWMQKNNAVALDIIFVDRRIYGLSYLRRWNNFSAGGGVLMSEEKFEGVKFQTEYWFSLW